ncbi:MAG: hypothetical protein HYU55_01060 [Nocardioides sp.]|nr:hypothetical protein [Nocardioides sp.]
MSRPTPSYGPPPPAKPRPSAWWFGLGIALLVAAVGAGIGLFVWTLSAFVHTDVEVPRDGAPHAVELASDGEQMLWNFDGDSVPACTVADRETGESVPLRAPGGEFRRGAGPVGDWVGAWRFDPVSEHVEVTCSRTGSGPGSLVEIGPAPRISSFVLGLLATIFVPLLLGLAGVAVLLVTGILWSLRPARGR